MRKVQFVPDLEHKESIHFQETGCIQVAVVGNKCHYKNMVCFLFELGRAHVNAHDTLKEKCYGLLQDLWLTKNLFSNSWHIPYIIVFWSVKPQ